MIKTIARFAVMGVGALLAGGVGVHFWQEWQGFKPGYTSYRNANCDAALPELQAFQDSDALLPVDWPLLSAVRDRAGAIVDECQGYKTALDRDRSGANNAAFAQYLQFAQARPDSILLGAVGSKLQTVLTESTPGQLASPAACPDLEGAIGAQILDPKHPSVPLIYLTCGRMYQQQNRGYGALTLFGQFLNRYPYHPQARSVRQQFLGLGGTPETLQNLNTSAREEVEVPEPSASAVLTRFGPIALAIGIPVALIIGVGTTGGRWRRWLSVPTIGAPNSTVRQDLYHLLQGDREAAHRLVELERSHHPGKSATWYWQAAIEHLVRDRSGR